MTRAYQPSPDIGSHLALITEMGQAFAESLDIDATLERALARIARHVGAEGGAVFLIDESRDELRCHASTGPSPITGLRLKRSEGIVGRCVRDNECAIVRDVAKDSSFDSSIDAVVGYQTRSLLCAPLRIQDSPLGAIELVNKRGGSGLFEHSDLQLLRTLAHSAALAISNARLTEELVSQERSRRELELAAEIQRNLLPQPSPRAAAVGGVNLPARVVSGDFFDYLRLPSGEIAFSVGDVSGKGMNAALLMAKTASLYRCISKKIPDPSEVLRVLNGELHETAARGMFVTMVAGTYDPSNGRVTIASAGHDPVLLHRADGRFETFPAQVPPLGILPSLPASDDFPRRDIEMNGGTLYVYTDGLTEARMISGDELGRKGLENLLRDPATGPLQERLERVVRGVGRGQPRDDVTLLAVDDGARVHARPTERTRLLDLHVPAAASELKRIRNSVRAATKRAGGPRPFVDDIVQVVDEAVQNVIRHAYAGADGQVRIDLCLEGDQLLVAVEDFAPSGRETELRSRDLDEVRPGGIGVHLIRRLMDDVKFEASESGHGNVLRMTRRIP